ncbi:MAG: hypothetical protein ACTSYZ_00645 [Candidatus Helarchaeota archaeon]
MDLESLGYEIEVIHNYIDNYDKIIYDLHVPLFKLALKVPWVSYSPESVLVLLKKDSTIMGHVCCFYNDKKQQLEFGFFGLKNKNDKNTMNGLLEIIEKYAKKWNVSKIIGPVNTPAGIYLYGFDSTKQIEYLNFFRENGYQDRHIYRIYEIPILPKRNVKKIHGLRHIESMEGIDRDFLKSELHKAAKIIIGDVSEDLIIPNEVWDAVFYLIDNYAYPECIQTAYNDNDEIQGSIIFLPNTNPEHLTNNGRTDELRIASAGWTRENTGKGYTLNHLYMFGNMCKKYHVKTLLGGQSDVSNYGVTRLMEKFGCKISYEHIVVEKNFT